MSEKDNKNEEKLNDNLDLETENDEETDNDLRAGLRRIGFL